MLYLAAESIKVYSSSREDVRKVHCSKFKFKFKFMFTFAGVASNTTPIDRLGLPFSLECGRKKGRKGERKKDKGDLRKPLGLVRWKDGRKKWENWVKGK